MAFVISGVEKLQLITPIHLGFGRLNNQLQQLRSSHQWASYTSALRQVQHVKLELQVFE